MHLDISFNTQYFISFFTEFYIVVINLTVKFNSMTKKLKYIKTFEKNHNNLSILQELWSITWKMFFIDNTVTYIYIAGGAMGDLVTRACHSSRDRNIIDAVAISASRAKCRRRMMQSFDLRMTCIASDARVQMRAHVQRTSAHFVCAISHVILAPPRISNVIIRMYETINSTLFGAPEWYY